MNLIKVTRISLVLLALPSLLGGIAVQAAPERTSKAESRTVKGPLEIELSAPLSSMSPGVTTTVQGRITARTDLKDVSLSVNGEGAVELFGDKAFSIGPLSPGRDALFEIPARFSEGHSQIRVEVTGADPDDPSRVHLRRGSFFAILRDGRSWSGMDGFLALELSAIEKDRREGLLTLSEARDRNRLVKRAVVAPATSEGLRRLAAEESIHPGERLLVVSDTKGRTSFEAQEIRTPFALPLDKLKPFDSPGTARDEASSRLEGIELEAAAAAVTVQGAVRWADENWTVADGINDTEHIHAATGMTVELYVRTGGSFARRDVTVADFGGRYRFFASLSADEEVGLRFITANAAVAVQAGPPHARHRAGCRSGRSHG